MKRVTAISAILVALLSLSACSGSTDTGVTASPTPESTSSQSTAVVEPETEEPLDPPSIALTEGVYVSERGGEWEVGKDIPAGRYLAETEYHVNLSVGSKFGVQTAKIDIFHSGLNETGSPFGVAYIDIADGNSLMADDGPITFTPVQSKLVNVLYPGTWVVGRDIAAGKFKMKSNVTIFGETLSGKPSEVSGFVEHLKSDGTQIESFAFYGEETPDGNKITLKDGEIVYVDGLELTFS